LRRPRGIIDSTGPFLFVQLCKGLRGQVPAGNLTAMSGPIILASASPRRLELLQMAGFEPLVAPGSINESTLPGESGVDLVVRLAQAKAATVDLSGDPPRGPVIAGDTVVVLDERILLKPIDAVDAREMLEQLSGRVHEVVSGWCVRCATVQGSGHQITQVRFSSLSRAQIDSYIETGEPLDKAGSYAIQGEGGALIEEVRGSWSNVVGMPLLPVVAAIREFMVR